jgi:AraC-like DNA-binding protein
MSGRLLGIAWESVAEQADFQPAKMANLCRISIRQLERFFNEKFDKTPSGWLRELQCMRAKNLLAEGYTNKAAAMELKFASQSHFCREFKKVFGTSPQAFASAAALNSKLQASSESSPLASPL